MDRKKILVFIGASYVSGLEIVTLHLITELRKNGNDVRCVISGWNDGVFIKKLKDHNIPFDEVKLGWIFLTKPFWTLDSLIHMPGAYLSCKKILSKFNPDICHFCGFGIPVILSSLLKNRNCVYNLQEPHAPTRKHLFIYRMLNKRIAIFTAVSEHIFKVLLDLGIPYNKIRLIYNGVPIATECPLIYAKNNIIKFAIIGQIVPWKGHDTLIDAIELLCEKFTDKFMIYLFGNDQNQYSDQLKLKIKNKRLDNYFVWKGFEEDQNLIYAQVDIVVVPSLSQEPCSLTILESMMRGKTIIASDRGGNPELINDKENGFIFKAGNPLSLREVAEAILSNEELLRQTGSNSRRKALENYTANKMADRYDQVYTEII